MLMAWNLIARTDSINTLRTSSIAWSMDAMTALFHRNKVDCAGKYTNYHHIYANVNRPAVDCILAMAIYLSTNQERSSNPNEADPKIFQGQRVQDNFNTYLKSFWQRHPEMTEELKNHYGTNYKEISSYSWRKGSVTYATTGTTVQVNREAVSIRAKWTQGVRDRYILYATPGDQMLGRILALLDYNSASFADLPHHFKEPSVPIVKEACQHQYPNDFKNGRLMEIIPFFVAQILGNFEYLNKNLHPNNPLRTTYLFTEGRNRRSLIKELANPRSYEKPRLMRTGVC